MTKIINLFAGPGAGKSTTAAGVFHLLKLKGVNAELVNEFAKQLVWDDRGHTLEVQPYVFGKQLHKTEMLIGKVDIIVTDSPILLSAVYCKDRYPESFKTAVREIFLAMDNINYYLDRGDRPYNPMGRRQSLESAKYVDTKVKNYLDEYGIPYTVLISNEETSRSIFNDVWAESVFTINPSMS